MSTLRGDAEQQAAARLAEQARWLARRRADADRPPLRPRLALLWEGQVIGSVEPAIPEALLRGGGGETMPLRQQVHDGAPACHVEGSLSASLARIANGLREAGLAHVWRNELVAVSGPDGSVLGQVERAVARPLGIPTRAVHLVGRTGDGRHWVQQRSLTKPNEPGYWDTLMGGMVPAGESVVDTLARETWEEAGLQLSQLQNLATGGRVFLRRPDVRGRGTGYIIEQIDWYRCTLPEGLVPVNQDGEVAQFRLMNTAELQLRLLQGDFTLEAALILAEALGWKP